MNVVTLAAPMDITNWHSVELRHTGAIHLALY
jgi:hypothetical protein